MIAALVALALAQTPSVTGPVYEIRTYVPVMGQMPRMHARFRDDALRLIAKHGMRSIGYWVPADDPDAKLVYILEFRSLEHRTKAWEAFRDDPEWYRVRTESEKAGPIVKEAKSVVLKPTDYSPRIRPTAGRDARLFELRTYVAGPGKLDSLNARFRDHTVRLFRKHGMNNIGYWTPVEPDQGSDTILVYLLAHRDAASAQRSWDGFMKDPAWIRARDASEQAGPILDGRPKREYLKPTDYSPTR